MEQGTPRRRHHQLSQLVVVRWLGAYGMASSLEDALRWELELADRPRSAAVHQVGSRPLGGLGLLVDVTRTRLVRVAALDCWSVELRDRRGRTRYLPSRSGGRQGRSWRMAADMAARGRGSYCEAIIERPVFLAVVVASASSEAVALAARLTGLPVVGWDDVARECLTENPRLAPEIGPGEPAAEIELAPTGGGRRRRRRSVEACQGCERTRETSTLALAWPFPGVPAAAIARRVAPWWSSEEEEDGRRRHWYCEGGTSCEWVLVAETTGPVPALARTQRRSMAVLDGLVEVRLSTTPAPGYVLLDDPSVVPHRLRIYLHIGDAADRRRCRLWSIRSIVALINKVLGELHSAGLLPASLSRVIIAKTPNP